MTWTETLRTAWEALNGRRMRSLLTMLGILIGIAAVMLTVGLGEGARLQIGKEINKLGSNLLIVMPGGSGGLSSGLSGSGSGGFTLSDAEVIADPAIAPDVAGVAPIMTSAATVQYGTADTSTQVNGTLPAWVDVRARTLAEGRFFTDAEQSSAAQVAVLGPETARTLFGQEAPVGKEIVVSGQSFVVIGVLESAGSASLSNDDDVLVVPMSTMAQRLSTPASALTIGTIYVAARDDASITAAHQEITNALTVNRQTTTADQDFSIFTFQALLSAANTMTGVLTTLLGGLAAISLIVGGIGVMNIMLVSVSERVREIGLRKALGATPKLIRRQFMVEAGILGLLGGALGVLVGLLGAAILTPLLNLEVTLSLPATLLALAVSLGIGIVAGVYPAARAANLPPIDALRSE
ncbi:MAG TPA: ABC transporter permease [Propioniciclava sp.]|jgi:putative ABC transport system permease protein|uniref:ABC transporter permease n=1 Tax=Propioniciclava sp. TaxID=2038686 RepID=UPI002B51E781|nr:ABC transporter permease [Propioniciclava sp.]HRL50236.1 ABC transporter permease [Propioniciclava sp.]HRL80284.1 ABC transporter permease [Propioniciclava sp.]